MKPQWVCVQVVGIFKPKDPKPADYVDQAEWARVQLAAGYRQKRRACGRYHFDFEKCDCPTP